jgi:hypothetical protein
MGARTAAAARWLQLVTALVGATAIVTVSARTSGAEPVNAVDAIDGVALVRMDGGPAIAQRGLVGRHGITAVEPLMGSPYVKVVAPGRSAAALVAALQRRADVADAEPDILLRAAEVPDDPLLSQQTFFGRINATDVWNVGDASSIKVAVIDSGVDLNHPDLAARLVPGWDFVSGDSTPEDGCGHGTAVAGVIGAVSDNGIGIASAGNGARIMPVRVLEPVIDENGDEQCVTSISKLVNAMNWAVANGAKVLNLSLGGSSGTTALHDAVRSAVNSGAVVVVAAGNSGGSTPEFPAAYPEAISVGSTSTSNTISAFSNRGADLVAPGESIMTTAWDPTDSHPSPYGSFQGTSFSAPIVAAVAARMLAVTQARTPSQIESDLKSTAFDLGTAGADSTYGAGIVDAHVALAPARAGVSDTGDGYEPNQLLGQPATPSFTPLPASFDSGGDVDWYRFQPAAGPWQVRVTPSSGVDPVVTVVEGDGDTIDENDDVGAGAPEQIGFSSNGSTPTFVRVANARVSVGTYTLILENVGPAATFVLPRPPVAHSSVPDRSTNVPTTLTVVLTAPTALTSSSVTTNTLNAVATSGGATRATSVSLDSSRTQVTATFTLATSQDYVLTVRGWRTSAGSTLRNGDPIRFRTSATPSTGGGTAPPPTPTTTTTTTPTTTTTAPPPSPAPTTTTPSRAGYWMVGRTGDVYAFGDARWFGNAPLPFGAVATNIAATPTGNGYWVVASNGGVYAFGDARFFGGSPALLPGESTTSISATPDGRGYWLFSNTGRVFAYGSAPHLGDMSGTRLNGGVLGSVATPSGRGYYMVAADGGIFSFGDAVFYGSMGGTRLNGPVVGLAPDPDGAGYWLVATDGGIFSFQAAFRGSMGSVRLNQPVIGMVAYGDGYLMVASDGGIFTFSSKPFAGSLGSNPPAQPIVAVSPLPG